MAYSCSFRGDSFVFGLYSTVSIPRRTWSAVSRTIIQLWVSGVAGIGASTSGLLGLWSSTSSPPPLLTWLPQIYLHTCGRIEKRHPSHITRLYFCSSLAWSVIQTACVGMAGQLIPCSWNIGEKAIGCWQGMQSFLCREVDGLPFCYQSMERILYIVMSVP